MISKFYQESVDTNTNFQLNSKVWGGWAVGLYAPTIKKLVEKYNAQSILDYGCGKGLHYTTPARYDGSAIEQKFQDYLGIREFFCYDPCVEQFNKLPNKKFDGVIVSQVLPFIPDDDIDWVIDLLMSYTDKFCMIGNLNPEKGMKQGKKELLNPEAFRAVRSIEWYETKLSKWSGSELVLDWK